MNITITFDNYNGGSEEGIRVYRDTVPILDSVLPAPIATLPAAATQFLDTTAVRGTKYYYRFGIFQGTSEVISPNKAVLAVAPEDTGAGPQTIAMGDWDLGYFGYCKSADLVSPGGLASALGVTAGTAVADYGWHKFAYKGKVLFVSRCSARAECPYLAVYHAGGIFGTNDNGAHVPSGGTPTNQYKLQTIGNFTYIPRVLKGMPEGSPLAAHKSEPTATALEPNEYDDLMAMVVNSPRSTVDQEYGKFTNTDHLFLPSGAQSEFVQGQPTWTTTATQGRGARSGGDGVVRISAISSFGVSLTTFNMAFGGSSYQTKINWRPVLELLM